MGQAGLSKSGRNTPRLYAAGTSIHQYPRAVRQAALFGTTSLDLAAVQLAVFSAKFGCDSVHQRLATGGSFWESVLHEVGFAPDYKDGLKNALYPMLMGMDRSRYEERLRTGERPLGDRIRHGDLPPFGEEGARRILAHPLIRELCDVQSHVLREIREGRLALVDAFGVELLYESWRERRRTPSGRWYYRDRDNSRQILARYLQSYEVRIMCGLLPVLERPANGITLASWLHDGVSLHFRDRRDRDRLVRQVQAAAAERADSLGIPTRLDLAIPKPREGAEGEE